MQKLKDLKKNQKLFQHYYQTKNILNNTKPVQLNCTGFIIEFLAENALKNNFYYNFEISSIKEEAESNAL